MHKSPKTLSENIYICSLSALPTILRSTELNYGQLLCRIFIAHGIKLWDGGYLVRALVGDSVR